MAGSANMDKMSRDRRKTKDLGSMRAARPMEDDSDAVADAEARAARAREMSMMPGPGVAERAMEEVRRERERTQMGEAYDRALKNYREGGYVKAADGCAQRGKTKGRMV